MFCSFLLCLAASLHLCYNEEATIVNKTVKLGFDLQGKHLHRVVGVGGQVWAVHMEAGGALTRLMLAAHSSPPEQCTQKAAKDYAQFYYVDELDGKLACVTKCTSGTKSQLNCHEGECQLQRSGPRCL